MDVISRAPEPSAWVLLSYHLPREPSAPRIALWRRFKVLGVARLQTNLVALPAEVRTREQMDWLAEQVVQNGGEAGVWLASAGAQRQEQDLIASITADRVEEYRQLAELITEAQLLSGAARNTAVKKLRRIWREISRRDYFPPPAKENTAQLLDDLALSLLDGSEVPAHSTRMTS
ncbi:Chromate resistance protein ChrB [Cryobacterium sp. TMS1-13-1]|uniref:Chromate resistance protein ChrB n=1 Tax=Cryobacterium sp. TMS1-13-1 TaxID=1259220 RepID=UPI0018E083C3|nr:Chromate resistance protein ChrB [Cryobacterium sp. TMS1-13-1]